MGVPKALLPFGDETMLQRIVRLLAGAVGPIVVVAAAGQEIPPLPASTIVARDLVPARGPLEGLRAGLRALPADTAEAYVTACDAPLLAPAFVARMVELVHGYDAAVVEVGGRPHPLSAAYHRRVLPRVESLLDRNEQRMTSLLDSVATRRIRADEMVSADPELLTVRNVNTPGEYREALSRAGLP
jgi:molybdopterin-guanine dinucleotide biosynthesis protein A